VYRLFFLLISFICLYKCHAQSKEQKSESERVQMLKHLENLEDRLKILEVPEENHKSTFKNVQVGLRFGFNAFTNGPKSYFIKEDSTIGEFGTTKGVRGMLSALVGYKLSEKHTIYLNIPLSDLTNGPNQTIGIFNKKVAGGLGYGYNIGKISIIGVVNIYPYEGLAIDVLSNNKFDQDTYTVLNGEDYPTVSKVSPSVTIGICYNFMQAKEMLNKSN